MRKDLLMARHDYQQRTYTLPGDRLEQTARHRVQVTVTVDGRPFLVQELREPGMLAIVSRLDSPDLTVHQVEVKRVEFTDYRSPNADAEGPQEITDWQAVALEGR
jgi:hypothetical protein